jgi:hypothetical protein
MKSVAMVLSTIMICLFTFTLSEAKVIDDLALTLSFEEGAGNTVNDLSGKGNDGTIKGNPQWVEGHFGKALYFDGKTYVVAPHIPFDKQSFTIQLWVKPEMTTEQEVVFSQYELNATNQSVHCRIYSDGRLLLGFYSNDLEAPAASAKKDQWQNLTFIFDANDSTRKIYVDGNEVAKDASPSAYLGAKGDIWIGGWERPTKPEHPFYQIYTGAIDEVRVWLRPLGNDEIMESIDTEMPVEPLGKSATTWGEIKLIR